MTGFPDFREKKKNIVNSKKSDTLRHQHARTGAIEMRIRDYTPEQRENDDLLPMLPLA